MQSTPSLLPPPPQRARLRVPRLLMELLVAISLAFLIWLYTRCRDQETLDMVSVPVQITLAADQTGNYELDIGGSTRIPVSFSGPPSRMRESRSQLQRGTVNIPVTVAVPEERQKDSIYRENLRVDASNVPVPPGVVAVVPEGRNIIPVTLYRLTECEVQVRLDGGGDSRISQVKVVPERVKVRGPKSVLDRLTVLPTQPYTVPAPRKRPRRAKGFRFVVRRRWFASWRDGSFSAFLIPLNSVCATRRRRAFLSWSMCRYIFSVHQVSPGSHAWRLPGNVKIQVMGPAGETAPQVQAFVDLTQGVFGEGRNIEQVQLRLPKDFRLVPDTPPRVAFFLEPLAVSSREE